jgi:hypothetical protein
MTLVRTLVPWLVTKCELHESIDQWTMGGSQRLRDCIVVVYWIEVAFLSDASHSLRFRS